MYVDWVDILQNGYIISLVSTHGIRKIYISWFHVRNSNSIDVCLVCIKIFHFFSFDFYVCFYVCFICFPCLFLILVCLLICFLDTFWLTLLPTYLTKISSTFKRKSERNNNTFVVVCFFFFNICFFFFHIILNLFGVFFFLLFPCENIIFRLHCKILFK